MELPDKLEWNGNEIVDSTKPNSGIAGIAPDQPDELAEVLVRAYNDYIWRLKESDK